MATAGTGELEATGKSETAAAGRGELAAAGKSEVRAVEVGILPVVRIKSSPVKNSFKSCVALFRFEFSMRSVDFWRIFGVLASARGEFARMLFPLDT